MKVTVERTFNLGNYENIRFTFEGAPGEKFDDMELMKVANQLAEKCHAAYEAYNRALQGMKARVEDEVKRITSMMSNGGKKP